MSKLNPETAFKLKMLDILDETLNEIDKLDTNGEGSGLVAWLGAFWGETLTACSTYANSKPESRKMIRDGINKRNETAKKLLAERTS